MITATSDTMPGQFGHKKFETYEEKRKNKKRWTSFLQKISQNLSLAIFCKEIIQSLSPKDY